MKCSKCGYVGFEHVDRCRNCGYDFSLTPVSDELPELPIRTSNDTPSPLDDLTLIDAATAPPPAVPMSDIGADLEQVLGAPASRTTTSPSAEPTLFGLSIDDGEPLITRASAPRAPLAVRRATPEVPRVRQGAAGGPGAPGSPGIDVQPRPQSFDLELDDPPPRARVATFSPADRAHLDGWPDARQDRAENAAVGIRLVAVAIDLVLLAAIDFVVVYFTLQICGLRWTDIGILPKVPLVAFLLVQNGGYLVAFTAGGQTLGKMATGIRVVGTESAGSLDLGRAVTRTIVWFLLAAPAGLGFLTLLGRDHRGLHDRFAGTRVVRASA